MSLNGRERGNLACPKCGAGSGVIDSRASGNGTDSIRRRRKCTNGHRFSTIELVAHEGDRRGETMDSRIRKQERVVAITQMRAALDEIEAGVKGERK